MKVKVTSSCKDHFETKNNVKNGTTSKIYSTEITEIKHLDEQKSTRPTKNEFKIKRLTCIRQ